MIAITSNGCIPWNAYYMETICLTSFWWFYCIACLLTSVITKRSALIFRSPSPVPIPPLPRCHTCSCLQSRWIESTNERGCSPFNAPSFVGRCIQHCGIHLSARRSYFISIYICLDRYSNRIKFVRNRSKYPLSNLLTSRRVFFLYGSCVCRDDIFPIIFFLCGDN